MIQSRDQVIWMSPTAKDPGHPRRIADLAVIGAVKRANRLLKDQRYAPRCEQRFERPAVEPADDQPLDQDAGDSGRQKGNRQGDQQRIAEQARPGGSNDLLHRERGIGTQHHHLAVRHVDHRPSRRR